MNNLKIVSRPEEHEEDEIKVGNGSIILLINDDQLELIAALVSHVRLGNGSPYKQAAYDLLTELENEFGSNFTSDACDNVDLEVTIEDSMGNVVVRANNTSYDITIEV